MTKFLKNVDVTGYVSQTSVTSSLVKTDANGKIVAATAGTDYQAPTAALLPVGGAAGQILSKIDAANYNTQWIDNFAAQLKHEVKLGATLAKGKAVYVSSANGTNMIVSAASNASEATSSKTLGLLETGGVTNDLVKVITEGLLAGLDTSTATAGDPVWLGTGGNLIFGLANKPVAPAHLVFIGIVTRVQSVNGEIFVKVQNGFELNEIHDVSISSLANNQTLVWESATSLWKNKTIAATLGYTPADDANVVKLTGNQTVAGVKTFTSVVNAPTLSLNGGVLSGNNIVSMRSNPTGGQFRIEKSDGSLSAYPFYIGSDGTALAYYYNAAGALKVLLHTDGTSYFGNNLSVGYTTYAATTYKLDVNGTARVVGPVLANAPSEGATGEGLIAGQSFKIDATATGQRAAMYVVSNVLSDTYASGLQAQYANFAGDKGFGFNLNTAGGFELYVKNTSWNKALTIANTKAATFTDTVTATSFIKTSGTSVQFLKADGSVDSSTYLTSSSLSGYLPLTGGTLTGALTIGPLDGQVLKLQSATSIGSSYLRFYNSAGASRGYFGLFWSGTADYMVLDAGSLEMNFGSSNKFTFTGGGPAIFSGAITANSDVTISTGSIKMYSVQNVAGQYRYIGTEYAAGNGNNKAEIRFGIDGSDTRTKITLHTANGGGQINEVLGVFASGQLKFNNYTASTSFTGTAAGYLAFDSSGNIITVASVAATDSTKLPLAGGTMTGALQISMGYPYLQLNDTIGSPTKSAYIQYGVTVGGAGASGGGYFLTYSQDKPFAWTVGTSQGIMILDSSGNLALKGVLQMSTSGTSYISMGRFPNSVSNSGEAWLGRAADRTTGTMTVQLGGGSATNRSFEVVDYAWSQVLFNVNADGNVYASNSFRAPIFYDSNDAAYYGNFASTSSLWGLAIRGDNGASSTENQIFFWGTGNTTTSSIGFKSNAAPFANPTANGDGYNTYFTMDTVGRGWVFRRGTGGTDFSSAYTAGWILNNGVAQFNNSVRSPIFYDSEDETYYVDPNSLSRINRLQVIGNWAGSPSPNQGAINIRGTYPSITFRNTVSNNMWLRHMDGSGDIQHYFASDGTDSSNWNIKHTMFGNGNFYSSGAHNASQFNGSGAGLTGTAGSLTSGAAGQLNTVYAGGQQTNPQVYFGQSVGLRVAMTGAWSVWSDTLWINGYGGGDVLQMCALHTLRNGTPRMAISVQASNSTSYGTIYEFITSYNIASQTVANTTSISSAVNSPYTWYGIQYFLTNNGTGAVNNSNTAALQAYSTGNNSAFMSFHRAGYYAVNMGLDSDNVFRIGGWSAGPNRLQLNLDSGAMSIVGAMSAPIYSGSVTGSSYGGIRVDGTTGGYSGIYLASSSGTVVGMYDAAGNGGDYDSSTGWHTYWLRSNTCLGIGGSTTASGYRMYVNGAAYIAGSLYATGDITAYSDVRKKKDIVTVDSALEKVIKLRGVYYIRIDDETNTRQLGVIAQETQSVVPEVVKYSEGTDEYGVTYGNFAGLFIEAFKEQQKQIEELKSIINDLTK
jgi:hypothetical protein